MFGLKEAEWNVVKRAARGLNDAIGAMAKEDRKKEQLVIKVIDEHHAPVALLIDRYKFIWTAGYLAGRVGNKNADYE